MAWATAQQALTWTGEALSDAELASASAIITLYSGRLEEEPQDAITALDRTWLAMATSYQAAWMRGKPGLLTQRESHTSSSSDGVQVTRESDSQVMLAPLASRCLRNLSWVGTRTTSQMPKAPPKGSFLLSDDHGWSAVNLS